MITVVNKRDLGAVCERERAAGRTVGLVPTMGSFHAGHVSLMRAARRECDLVVVTIFVNPLQFGLGEDLAGYPRDLVGDSAIAGAEGVDVLFAPSDDEMYPEPMRTTVHVDGLTEGLCGAARPTHFDGVTTVVAKLFAIVGPCRAYFGRKDAQQLAVVRRMTDDLDLPVDVVGCPLVREPDGLAMSSRNAYLAPEEREAAAIISRALYWGAETVNRGERDAHALAATVRSTIETRPEVALEYVEVRAAEDLVPVAVLAGAAVVAVAARVGTARLIDNMTLTFDAGGVRADLGVVAHDRSVQPCSA